MKKIGIFFLLLLCLLQVLPLRSMASGEDLGCSTLQARHALAEAEPYTGTAKAVILYEQNTQTLVYAHNPDLPINPTGLIKLLTALIVLEEGNLEDVVTVKRSTLNSVGVGSVSAGLQAGEEITLRDLLYCVMVSSANDAAAVMAEHVAGSQAEFVKKMNERAATLGCVNTHFTNVHGLKDDRQLSTARELAIITAEALKNPAFCELFAVTEYIVPATNLSAARNLSTTNYMMDPDSKYYDSRVTGGKPAAASTSDRSIICTAQTEDARYLCVVISAKARISGSSVTRFTNFDEAGKMLTFGLEGFAVQQVLGMEQPFGMYPVEGGENDLVIGPDSQVFAMLPTKFDPTKLTFEDVRDAAALRAPVAEGTAVGTLRIYYDALLIAQVHLMARHSVAPVGTTIQKPDPVGSGAGGVLGMFLKWTGIILAAVLLFAAAVVLVLRRINLSRRKNSRRRVPGTRERR